MAQFIEFETGVAKTGNGFIQLPLFDTIITDLTGKRGVLMQRIKTKRASGNPTRYFEKQAATRTAAFQDPHALAASKFNVKMVEKAAFIKAITNEIEFTHFDREVGQQQGIFRGLTDEHIRDMVTDLLQLQDEKVWTGNDTSLNESTTNEYVGLLTQIKQKGEITDGTLITDAIRTEVARLYAQKEYNVKPSIVYVNPMTMDLIEQEEQTRPNTRKNYEVEVVAGIKVPAIMTAAGLLPIVADPYLPIEDGTSGDAGKKLHHVVILSENLIERDYVGSPKPRIFSFGIHDESLNEKYMALQYDCVIAKGEEYAHTILTKKMAAE